MALLYSDAVPQSKDCELGPLWLNCDDERLVPLDHETSQIFADGENSYQLQNDEAAVIFYFQTVNYRASPTKIEAADYTLIIDIVANAAGGEQRQDILDAIEERILYRLYSYADFVDASTGETLRSFMRALDRNTLTVATVDDSNFNGRYTIRSMRLGFTTNECILRPGCDDAPICFDFDIVPDFGKGC